MAVSVVLWVLLVYHVCIGSVSVLSARQTATFSRWFYGTRLTLDAQAIYMLKALGMYALFTAAVIGVALTDVERLRPLLWCVAGLQLLRAASRVLFYETLYSGMAVPRSRNAFNVALLLIEAGVLVAC